MYQVGIKQIVPSELTAEDIRWLVVGAYSVKFFEVSAEITVERAKKREVLLYRITGDAQGMLVVSAADSDFFIEALAGKNFLKCAKEIHELCQITAKTLGKTRIAGWVARGGLSELYDQFGAKAVATLYVEDL